MRQVKRLCFTLLGCIAAVAGGCASRNSDAVPGPLPPQWPSSTGAVAAPAPLAAPQTVAPAAGSSAVVPADLPVAVVPQPDDRPLPISLPTALKLANVRAVDVAAATERTKVAAAQLAGAQVLWLPSMTFGGDYARHDGQIQNEEGQVFTNNFSSAMMGIGSGLFNSSILDIGNSIFAPLYAKQQVRAREADLQAASNDTLVAVSDAYFTVQQARGELAGAMDARRRINELVAVLHKMSPAITPEFELFRAETEQSRREQAELLARERWKVTGSELLRVLRLDPLAQVDPLEPPHLQLKLIDLGKPDDELIPVGLTHRPELASNQAQVQATLTLLKQERLRPLIPSVLLRGFSTPVAGTLAAGYFAGGNNSSIANGGLREDLDLQLLWQLNNLGFGNRALVQQRLAENRVAIINLFKLQDRVAAEVAQAHAQARLAGMRVEAAEKEIRMAHRSAEKNMAALRQTKAVGNQLVTLVRPLEVVSAIQALSQAYLDYYGAVADANRAQFRLYRALGQPAQYLIKDAVAEVPGDPAGATGPVAQPASPPIEPLPAVPARELPPGVQSP